MKRKYLYILILTLCSCSPKSDNLDEGDELKNVSPKELVIIYNRFQINTTFNNRATSPKESFYYVRDGFGDPNLHISVFHGLELNHSEVARKDLEKMTVWFDSEMEYEDWFTLNFDKYYMIYQDEFLVKGSLKPDYKFILYEIKVATGGTY